jgi:hypothetical protein
MTVNTFFIHTAEFELGDVPPTVNLSQGHCDYPSGDKKEEEDDDVPAISADADVSSLLLFL